MFVELIVSFEVTSTKEYSVSGVSPPVMMTFTVPTDLPGRVIQFFIYNFSFFILHSSFSPFSPSLIDTCSSYAASGEKPPLLLLWASNPLHQPLPQ